MAKHLRLTGLASYAHPNLYGYSPRRNQIVRSSDEDAAKLLSALTKDADGNSIRVFTQVPTDTVPTYDLSNRTKHDGLMAGVAFDGDKGVLRIPGYDAKIPVLTQDPKTRKLYGSQGEVLFGDNSQLAKNFGFDVPAVETSGRTFRDFTDCGSNLSALTALVNPHANAGYITTEAISGGIVTLPAKKFNFDLAKDSFMFSMLVNMASPGANTNLAGNIASLTDGYGFYLSGRVGGVVAPVFNAAGGNWSVATGYPTSVLGQALDATDHTVTIAYDAPSRSVYYWLDGVLRACFTNVIRPGVASRSTYPLGLGASAGLTGMPGAACKYANIKARVWENSGLPLNIGAVVRTAAVYGKDMRYLSDIYPPAAPECLSAIAWVGQSNEFGATNWPDASGALGAPTRDTLAASGVTSINAPVAGSMHPQIASLGGRRGMWRSTFNTANGATSITQFWCGQFVSWAAAARYSKGAYCIASGRIYKLTSSTSSESPNVAVVGAGPVTWPTSGTVVDGEATWTFVRNATAADVVGTVLTMDNPLFDPNGALAVIKTNFDLLPAVYDGRKFVCISIGQGDKTVGSTRAQYAAAIQNATSYLLAQGYKVLIGFTCSGVTTGLDAWLSGVGKPGYQDALAYFANNNRVFPGADLYTSLGPLTVNADGIGLLSDQVHMNRHTTPLAASYWDAALADAGA